VLPLKDLWGRAVGEKVTGWGGEILKELGGLPGGRAWFAGTLLRQGCGGQAESGAEYNNNYCILVQLVKDYFKWFGWREIALSIRLLFPSLGRSTAAKFTRSKEPTPSSNQPLLLRSVRL